MKKCVRFLAFFCAVTLLFSCFFTGSASDNDARFDSYINMGDAAVQNNYAIPNLFRQNEPYSNQSKFPLVVKNGVEYVPLSMFSLYSYVTIKYSETSDNFFLWNTGNNHYISFNLKKGVASTYDGDLLRMDAPIFNKTRYVPARTVALVLGFTNETYDDREKGVYAFRISDGRTGKTLNELLAPYLAENEDKNDEPLPPYPPVFVQEDPLESIAKRRVAVCYTNLAYENMRRVVDTLRGYGAKASFSVTKEDVLERTQLVREVFVQGHSLLVTAPAYGTSAAEYAESFIGGLEEANGALKAVLKRKTRMCTLPFDLPEEIKNSREFLSAVENAGYIILSPNVDTGDVPGYAGSAYAVSGKIKNKITDGFDTEKTASVTALVNCTDKTQYYTADLGNFMRKYPQHEYYPMDEAFLYNCQGEE